MPSETATIDSSSSPRARDRLLCQWAGPFFRGACDFLYEPVRGNRATWSGPASWKSDQTFFLAPNFPTGSYALARNSGSEQAVIDLTVAGWIKMATVPPSSVIFGNLVTGTGKVKLGYAIGSLFFETDSNVLSYVVPLVAGRWYHFAATFAAGAKFLFLDGLPVASNSGHVMTYPLTQAPVLAGQNEDGVKSGFFNGRLFDVRLYSRRLLDEEIIDLANPVISQRLFQRPSTPVTPPPPTPPPPSPLLNQPPYYRTVVKGQTYADETSPIIFEQMYGEPWTTADDATEIKAILTKGSGRYGVAGSTIEKTVLFATIVDPSLWFSLSASDTEGMADGEWTGEIVGYESSGAVAEVYRKFTLFVRD